MPTAVLGLAALPPGHFYSSDAVLKAAKHEQRRAAANAAVAQQLGAQSVEVFWGEAIAKPDAIARAPRKDGPPDAAKPALGTAIDKLWTETLAKTRGAIFRASP